MIFPLADMSLYDYLRSDDEPEISTLFQRVYDLTKALHDLHNFGFEEGATKLRMLGYHHNLEPKNILAYNGRFVMTGFDLANFTHIDQIPKIQWGMRLSLTRTYSPPEVNYDDVGQGYDIWSLGCILAEVATFAIMGREGVEDFAQCRATPIRMGYFHDGKGVKPEVLQHLHNLAPLAVSKSEPVILRILELVKKMLEPDEGQRPRSGKVLEELSEIIILDKQKKSFELLPPLASQLIQLCAFLGNCDIPEEMLYRGRKAVPWLRKGKCYRNE